MNRLKIKKILAIENKFIFFCGIALTLLLTAPLPAKQRELKFTYLGVKEGLSQSAVSQIIKDHKGFMWFATKDGLNRFDGIRFTIFNHEMDDPESLSSNTVKVIHEDLHGILWVGTESGGLNRLESGSNRFRHYRHDPRDPGSINDDSISAICQDRRGDLWVGTEQGLDCLRAGTDTFIHFRPDPKDEGAIAGRSVKFLIADNDDRIWIGLQRLGLDCYERKTGRFRHYRRAEQNPRTMDSDSVNSACLAPDGTFWIGTANGINHLDPGSGLISHFREAGLIEVIALTADSQGNIWAGTEGSGIFFFDAGSRQFSHYRYDRKNPEGINADSILSLYADDTGNLWVGTNGMGINMAYLQSNRFTNFIHDAGNPNSLSFASIRTILETRDRRLYIGGYGGLDCFNRRSGEWDHFTSGLSNRDIYVLCPNSDDEKDLVWVGTEGDGLYVFDPVKQHFTANPIPGLRGKMIFVLYKDRQGGLWIGSNEGLSHYDRKTKQVRFIELRQAIESELAAIPDVRSLLEDRSGSLWVGSDRYGLFFLDRNSGQWRRFFYDPQNPRSLNNNWVTAIYESGTGEMWLGTNGGGLNLLDRATWTFTHFTAKNGLPNNVVYGILEDSTGCLWLSTNLGLSKFNPQTRTFRNFNEKDGLFGNEFNGNAFHKSRWSGEMFFGGVSGMTAFFPTDIKDDAYVPAVVITDFKIFNRSLQPGPDSPLKKPISETRDLTLSFRDSMLTFEFIGLHYVAPTKNLYAYRMEGFDLEWNYTDASRRFATYTNLDPGDYTFRVKAANSDGIWNEAGASIRIRITPPFWKTWWFIGFSALFIGGTAVGIVQMRIRRLTNAKHELEQIVDQRTRELKDLSLKDPLTGLRNRRFILEVLQTDISAFIKYKHYLLNAKNQRRDNSENAVFGLFLMDIDFFKKVNDTYGHDAGDRVLKQFATILTGSVRPDDAVMRVGGDEFLVVLKKTMPEYLHIFVVKVLEKMATTPFAIGGGTTIQKTCSIGYASFPVYKKQPGLFTFEQSTMIADLGLFHAKNLGRNQGICLRSGPRIPSGKEIIQKTVTSLEFALQEGYLQIGNPSGSISD